MLTDKQARRGSVDRRQLLRWLTLGPAALALASRQGLAAAANAPLERSAWAPRDLSLRNLHTDERMVVRYFDQGAYLPQALARLNHLLRDHRSGEATTMDPGLFDQLHVLAACAGCEPHYEIISGYRSSRSNETLRETSSGVAKHSLHMEGRAIDVRLHGTACSSLRDLALAQGRGGVGYYAKSDFVHLDTGRVRSWAG